jgi:hypothetical protein
MFITNINDNCRDIRLANWYDLTRIETTGCTIHGRRHGLCGYVSVRVRNMMAIKYITIDLYVSINITPG